MEHHEFSPSRLKMYLLCPAAFKMEKGQPDIPSEDAEFGTAIHKAIETGNTESLSVLQIELYGLCKDQLRQDLIWEHEKRVSLKDGDSEILFGTVDAIAETDDKVIAYDWKFGRNPVDSVVSNWQAKAYAAAIMQTYLKDCEFHIFQPTLKFHDVYEFSVFDCDDIVLQIKEIIEKAKSEDWVFNPGEEQCRYCKAKAVCQPYIKSNAKVGENAILSIDHTHELSSRDLSAFYSAWVEFRKRYKTAEKIAKNIEYNIISRLMKNQCEGLEYFTLKPKPGRRVVTGPNELFNEVSDVLSTEDFLSCVSITLTKLESVYCKRRNEKTGESKGQSAKLLSEIINRHSKRTGDGYSLVYAFENEEENKQNQIEEGE